MNFLVTEESHELIKEAFRRNPTPSGAILSLLDYMLVHRDMMEKNHNEAVILFETKIKELRKSISDLITFSNRFIEFEDREFKNTIKKDIDSMNKSIEVLSVELSKILRKTDNNNKLSSISDKEKLEVPPVRVPISSRRKIRKLNHDGSNGENLKKKTSIRNSWDEWQQNPLNKGNLIVQGEKRIRKPSAFFS